jgi:hypothetical protein
MAADRRARKTERRVRFISDATKEAWANNRRKKEPEVEPEIADYLRLPAKVTLATVSFLTAPDPLMGLDI